jgi:hypothetical protein
MAGIATKAPLRVERVDVPGSELRKFAKAHTGEKPAELSIEHRTRKASADPAQQKIVTGPQREFPLVVRVKEVSLEEMERMVGPRKSSDSSDAYKKVRKSRGY